MSSRSANLWWRFLESGTRLDRSSSSTIATHIDYVDDADCAAIEISPNILPDPDPKLPLPLLRKYEEPRFLSLQKSAGHENTWRMDEQRETSAKTDPLGSRNRTVYPAEKGGVFSFAPLGAQLASNRPWACPWAPCAEAQADGSTKDGPPSAHRRKGRRLGSGELGGLGSWVFGSWSKLG